jgi:hypothetical protein
MRLVVTRQANCVPKLLKPFCEAKKHTSSSVGRVSRNAANRDDLKGSQLKKLHTSHK